MVVLVGRRQGRERPLTTGTGVEQNTEVRSHGAGAEKHGQVLGGLLWGGGGPDKPE